MENLLPVVWRSRPLAGEDLGDLMNSRSIQCCITVRGRVGPHWSRWLGELQLSYRLNGDGGEVTDLTGILPDQTAL